MTTRLLLVGLLALGCEDDGRGFRALEASGFTDIQMKGYAWVGCGQDDAYSTHFAATNSAGKRVSGVVCCGSLKGCTVRF